MPVTTKSTGHRRATNEEGYHNVASHTVGHQGQEWEGRDNTLIESSTSSWLFELDLCTQ